MSKPAMKLFEPKPEGRICLDCNLRRTLAEFVAFGMQWLNCRNCWARHGRKPQ